MSLAVFDFDGTLIEGDAGVHFARHILQKGYLQALTQGSLGDRAQELTRVNWATARLLFDHVRLHARYRSGAISRRQMVQKAYAHFEGHEVEYVREELRAFAREKLPRHLRSRTVDRLVTHAEQGDHVVVLSTGLHDLIWPTREAIGHPFETVACRLKHRDGVLTGEVEGPMTGAEKATRLVSIASREEHDLEDAYAYADHETDADMLQVVGNPVVVHPTDAMRRCAEQESWPVIDE